MSRFTRVFLLAMPLTLFLFIIKLYFDNWFTNYFLQAFALGGMFTLVNMWLPLSKHDLIKVNERQ
jgi:hypothetical protein